MSPAIAAFVAENWQALVGVLFTIFGGIWTVFVFFAKQTEPAGPKPSPNRIRRELASPWNGVLLCVIGAGVLCWQLIASWSSFEQAGVCSDDTLFANRIQVETFNFNPKGDSTINC